MMAQSRAESTRDTYNYGQYINQFPPNTIKVIREFERIQKKICRHKMSIIFNEICINEEMLPKYTYMYIYTNFIKHNSIFCLRYFSTGFVRILPYCFYRIRRELIIVLSIVVCIPSTFCPTFGPLSRKGLLQKWCNFCFLHFTTISTVKTPYIVVKVIDPPLMMV